MQAPTLPSPPQRKWTDEQRQQVKALLLNGATAAQVAKAMHIGRNAALGRIWRDPDLTLQPFPRPKTIFIRPSKPKRLPKPPPPPKPIAPTTPPKPPVAVIPTVCHPMPLIDTGSLWCKWPVAMAPDVLGGVLCCGAKSLKGDVYCSQHRVLSRQTRIDHDVRNRR